jgi:polyhydroxyalkanoate synthesis regulator phasin
MIDYLRNRGMDNMNEQEFKHKFKDFMTRYKRNSMKFEEDDLFDNDRMDNFYRCGRTHEFIDMDDFDKRKYSMDDDDIHRMMRYMRHSMEEEGKLTEHEAKHIVSEMYHMENGRKHTGEKFDMYKAKEVCERYRGILPSSVNPIDVYIAINSQYHDYSELFKVWFGDNIDQKIIESAVVFWFKDADAKSKNKVANYFKEY